MKKLFLYIMPLMLLSFFAKSQDITGTWNGKLTINDNMQLRLVLHITKEGDTYKSTLDSPDQGAKGIPVSQTAFEGSKLTVEVYAASISYSAELKGDKFVGTFKQGGNVLPLELVKGNIIAEAPQRPQEPQKPYPYYSEEVNFENTKDKITLAGTLTLPQKEGAYPTVVLISGSGPQNRDEELVGHKPFLVIADYLTRNGIAVLRYDDRGVGQSKGNFKSASSADFANDVDAAVTYLKTRKEVKQIGLMGHSEGGLIAPMVAANNKNVNFIVLLAGTGIRGDKLLLMQQELISRANGVSEKDIDLTKKLNSSVFDLIVSSDGDEVLKKDLNNYFVQALKENPDIKPKQMTDQAFIDVQIKGLMTPWMKFFLKYDPATNLAKVKCPVLAINGEKDLQVPAKENLEVIEKLVKNAGNQDITVRAYPHLNHLFQEAKTGSPMEYPTIQQTFSPLVLEDCLKWIVEKTK